MDQATRRIVLEAVKSAIITELRGEEIYQAAADRATDPAAKVMFESLALDERQHKAFLETNFKSLLENGTWAVPVSTEALTPLDSTEVITSDFLKRVKGGAFEMAVIAAGCELERSAIDFYTKASQDCPDEESSRVFKFLADWEEGHLRALAELEERMRDEYFSDQGFAPF